MPKFNALKSKEAYTIFKLIFKHAYTNKKPITLTELMEKSTNKTSVSGLSEKVESLVEAGLILKNKSGKYILIEPKVNVFELYEPKELLKIFDNKKIETIQDMVLMCSSIALPKELASAIMKEFV